MLYMTDVSEGWDAQEQDAGFPPGPSSRMHHNVFVT